MESSTAAAERLRQIKVRMAFAAEEAGCDIADLTLIAVSKTFDETEITPVIEAGHRVFGENRVQEAKAKWPSLRARYPDLELHLIGPLQSNKVKEAVALFDAIHTIDRPKIARAIAAEMEAQGRSPTLFIQVNIGRELQKSGVMPEMAKALYLQCRDEFGLQIAGLMCIPPLDVPPEPYFDELDELATSLGLNSLSMGMSADFEAAIRYGATHIRVGSAIFGNRDYSQ